jgi:propanol-preferring alcohol dehydrogenase
MLAMVLDSPGEPLRATTLPVPAPQAGEVLLRVRACGVCRTDLHIVDGELPPHKLPLVPGHEIVGTVAQLGPGVDGVRVGQRVGVPWLADSCGHCQWCLSGRENLCDQAAFTGYDRDGGYAEYTVAKAAYCVTLPDAYDDAHAAPLLCAGLIGYRAYSMANAGSGPDLARGPRLLGLYGFGAAAHIIAQVAVQQGREVYAFTRPGDARSQQYALALGAGWAGSSAAAPPVPLDAAIVFAPNGELVPRALAASAKGATVVCAGIHMSDIPSFSYALLWGERCVRSVANLTRADGAAFMQLASTMKITTAPVVYPLREANAALADLRAGRFDGAAVLVPG